MERQKSFRSPLAAFAEFANDERGQDLVEYSLLLAFVCLMSAALFVGTGRSIAAIWCITNTSMSQAASAAVVPS